MDKEYNMSEIEPNLCLSGVPPYDKQYFLNNRFVAILNVSDELPMPEWVRDSGIEYKKIPMKDTSDFEVSLDMIYECCKFISSNMLKGKVLVHCLMGISRSAIIVIAFEMWYRRMNYVEALAFVRNRRREVSPNMGFEIALEYIDLKKLHDFDLNLPRYPENIPLPSSPRAPEESSSLLSLFPLFGAINSSITSSINSPLKLW